MTTSQTPETRAAENESAFRRHNEAIKASAEALDYHAPIPFICECGEPSCLEIVRLTADDYEAVRDDGTHFFVKPGHEDKPMVFGEVIGRHDGFVVVKKIGPGMEIVAERDPRGDD